jgi:hypothetical protein
MWQATRPSPISMSQRSSGSPRELLVHLDRLVELAAALRIVAT